MKIIKAAKDAARLMAEGSECAFRHGAAIVRNGKIIALGRNYRTYSGRGNTRHAEIDAIMRTKLSALRGATIIVFGKKPGGLWNNSRPCPNCEAVLKKLRFKKMVCSTQKPDQWTTEQIGTTKREN